MPIETGSLSLGFLAGTLIGAVATHYLTKSRNIEEKRVKDYNKAAETFRSAFDDTLVLLRKNFRDKTIMVDRIVTTEVLDRHDKARIQFEPFLDKSSITGFNAAWEAYEKYRENYNISNPDDMSIRYISFKIIDHIYALLDYAKPKF